jgi:hypothetical protein
VWKFSTANEILAFSNPACHFFLDLPLLEAQRFRGSERFVQRGRKTILDSGIQLSFLPAAKVPSAALIMDVIPAQKKMRHAPWKSLQRSESSSLGTKSSSCARASSSSAQMFAPTTTQWYTVPFYKLSQAISPPIALKDDEPPLSTYAFTEVPLVRVDDVDMRLRIHRTISD